MNIFIDNIFIPGRQVMNIFRDKSVLETGNPHLAEVTVHTYIDTA